MASPALGQIQKINHEESVSLASRYAAASTELGSRIQARQMSFLFYATGSAALLGTMLQRNSDANSAPGHYSEWMTILYGVLPSIFSFAFACWVRHHDVLIGLLDAFMRFCEDPEGHDCELSWHGPDRGCVIHAYGSRFWLDLGFMAVCISTVMTTALFAALHAAWSRALIACLSAFFMGVTFWTIVGIQHQRRSIFKQATVSLDEKSRRNVKYGPQIAFRRWKRLAVVVLLIILAIAVALDVWSYDGSAQNDLPNWYPHAIGVVSLLVGLMTIPLLRGYDLGEVSRFALRSLGIRDTGELQL